MSAFFASLVFLFVLICAPMHAFQIETILRTDRSPPTCNTHILYDDTNVLVVDLGKVYDDALETQAFLDPLLADGSRTLRGFFVTHGHPDHCTQAWHMQQLYPSAAVYVASEEVKTEMVVLMRAFGQYLNQSSPGNPDGIAPHKFDYDGPNVRIAQSGRDLWGTSEVELFHDQGRLGETNHYAWLEVRPQGTTDVHLVSGDIFYSRAHIFMGFGVTLMAQCDWLNVLRNFGARFGTSAQVTVYPGHGNVTSDYKALVAENIAYIEYARSVYATACNATAAATAILAKFPDFCDVAMLQSFSAPARVPADALSLGCKCPQRCAFDPPACFV